MKLGSEMNNNIKRSEHREADYKDAEAAEKAARDFDISSKGTAAKEREGRSGVQYSYKGETIGPTDERGNLPSNKPGDMTARGKKSK